MIFNHSHLFWAVNFLKKDMEYYLEHRPFSVLQTLIQRLRYCAGTRLRPLVKKHHFYFAFNKILLTK